MRTLIYREDELSGCHLSERIKMRNIKIKRYKDHADIKHIPGTNKLKINHGNTNQIDQP